MKFVRELIVKLNNGYHNSFGSIYIKKNIFCIKILHCLYNHGFILGFFEFNNGIIIYLKNKGSVNAFTKIKILKNNGLSLYFRYKDKNKLNYLKKDLVILSTSRGLLTLEEAYKLKVGGEFLFLIIL